MNTNLLYLTLVIILFFSACNTIEEKGVIYTLVRDNLYSDERRNLYLKSINNEDIKNTYNVWLRTVYCDTCGTARGKGDKELKDIVDIATFHRDAYLENEDVVIYADKKK